MSNVNLPFSCLKLLPLVLSLQAMIKSLSQSFLQSTSHKGVLGKFSSSAWTPSAQQVLWMGRELGFLGC